VLGLRTTEIGGEGRTLRGRGSGIEDVWRGGAREMEKKEGLRQPDWASGADMLAACPDGIEAYAAIWKVPFAFGNSARDVKSRARERGMRSVGSFTSTRPSCRLQCQSHIIN
jgi:hypothetical protein